jgi:hypothetical protein
MLKYHIIENIPVAELTDTDIKISEVQDVLDLMGDCGSHNCNMIIIRDVSLHKDFFRLHTRLAGEILQKFSTYDFRLVIVGDFSKYKSKNLHDFIRESNRGKNVFFVSNMDDALRIITRF